MENWNVADSREEDADYVLLNSSNTPIRVAQNVRVDLGALMSRLEELDVPLSYGENLREIYFTHLSRSGNHGDYSNDVVRISCGPDDRDVLVHTFVHELGHHVDDIEGISDREWIVAEKKSGGWRALDRRARSNVMEYVAWGFEVFYCGSRDARARMRRECPKLYGAIRRVHAKYRDR